jgi:DNA-binding XRE family transcriptional regulator
MDKKEFSKARARLGKTQAQMAKLLRTSLKAVQSYEQGWRTIPAHAESQVLLLLSLKKHPKGRKDCWITLHCPPERRKDCPAWEFKAGKLCWFINGTMCEGKAQKNWQSKMKICRSCKVMAFLLAPE